MSMEHLTEALSNFNLALQTMGSASVLLSTAEPDKEDEARTVLWQACEVLDRAAEELEKAIKAATGETRGEIRRARLGQISTGNARPALILPGSGEEQ